MPCDSTPPRPTTKSGTVDQDYWPVDDQQPKFATANDILSRAAEREPDAVYALVSGGHDSLTAMHTAYASDHLELDGIIHVNTGIGVPQTRTFTKARAESLGLDYIELQNDRFGQRYRDLVTGYGFPGPAGHLWMYVSLKEKPLQRWVIDTGTGYHPVDDPDADIMFISGVRRAESDRRKVNIDATGIQEHLGATWVSPIAEWTDDELDEYRQLRGLPNNPVVTLLGSSGECLCGAFAARSELTDLRAFYPDVYRQIQYLELDVLDHVNAGEVARKYALWGHGKVRDRELEARTDDRQMTLCADCEDGEGCSYEPGKNPLTMAEAMLQDSAFDDGHPEMYDSRSLPLNIHRAGQSTSDDETPELGANLTFADPGDNSTLADFVS